MAGELKKVSSGHVAGIARPGTAPLESRVRDLEERVNEIVGRMNGALSLGTAVNLTSAGNLSAQWLRVACPSISDTEFEVPHGLGRTPVAVLAPINADGAIVSVGPTLTWNARRIAVSCDTADAQVLLLVL